MVNAWNAVVLNENCAETATLSGGSYSLPLTNMQDRDTSIVARTTNATNASTIIIADLGSAQIIGGVAVCNGNWSLDSTYRLQIASDAGFTTLLYDSGAGVSFPGFVVSPSLLDPTDPDYSDGVLRHTLLSEFPLNLIHILSSDVTARYIKISFNDTTNASGYLQYGYLMIGRAFRPLINYGENNSFSLSPSSSMFESLGLKRVWSEYGIKRIWSAAFPSMDTDPAFRTLARMMVKSRDSRPVFVVPDPSDVLHLQNRSFLATFNKLPAIQQLLVDRATTAFEFREL